MQWPEDPLGGRRSTVERAAELVRTTPPSAKGDFQQHVV
jgi:hypothetical protein